MVFCRELRLDKSGIAGTLNRVLKRLPRAGHLLVSPAATRDEDGRREGWRVQRQRYYLPHLFQTLCYIVSTDCHLSFGLLPQFKYQRTPWWRIIALVAIE